MAETDSLNPPSAPVESPEKHQRQGTPASGGRSKKGVWKRRVKIVKSRARASRPYPASSFKEATPIAEAIHQFASGQKVRRLTLLKQINKSPNSGPTKQLITNSGKYKLTTGSYAAEWLALTPEGSVATGPSPLTKEKLRAQFALAVKGIEPFFKLYDEYRGKKLPSHDVMKDLLRYTLVPKLETYRSEIATHVRAALADGTTGNPITVFLPGVRVIMPPEK